MQMSNVCLMGLVLATLCVHALAATKASAGDQTDGAIPDFSSMDFPWLMVNRIADTGIHTT
jgi:hypothetical protein